MELSTLTKFAQAARDLDFSEENDHFNRTSAAIRELQATMERGDERIRAINREIAEVKDKGKNEGAIADTMMRSEVLADVLDASPSIDRLLDERDSIRLGIRELNTRIEQGRATQALIESAAFAKAIPLALPLLSELEAEAVDLAVRFQRLYTCAVAMRAALRFGERLVDDLHGVLSEIAKPGGILPWDPSKAAQPVPLELQEALAALKGKGPALKPSLLSTVNLHR